MSFFCILIFNCSSKKYSRPLSIAGCCIFLLCSFVSPGNDRIKKIRTLHSDKVARIEDFGDFMRYKKDKETEKKLNNAIKKTGISKSKWIAKRIKENTDTTWPETVKKIAGTWGDLPTAEKIRAEMGEDSEREPI